MTFPPLNYLKIGGVAVILSIAFYGGCTTQKRIDSVKIGLLENSVERKKDALKAASEALRTAASHLRKQNALNEEYLNKIEDIQEQQAVASEVAEEALQKAKRRAADFEKRYKEALEDPDCLTLTMMDIAKVCGL